MRKTLLLTTLSIVAFSLFGCSDTSTSESTTQIEKNAQVESTTQAKTEISSESTEKSTSAPLSDEEYEKREQKQKQEAKEFDQKIWTLVQKVDSSTDELFNELQKYSDNSSTANLTTLYETAKQTSEALDTCFYEANDISSESGDLYSNSLTFYIMNRQDIAQNLIWYIDTMDQKYMDTIQERMDNANDLTLDLMQERSNFLQENGFSDKEINQIISK